MARGNRCYLCGGKLRRGRCIECGLDNDRMTRRDYRLNVTTPYHVKKQQVAIQKAENKKYEQVYENKQQSMENWGKPISEKKKVPVSRPTHIPSKNNTGRTVYQQQEKRTVAERTRKKSWVGPAVGFAFILFPLLGELGSCITDVVDEFSYKTPEYAISEVEEVLPEDSYPQESISEDDYAFVTRELSDDGDHYDNVLGPGNYIVGVHIPEGTYTAEIEEGSYIYCYLQDDENGIYISLNLGEDAYNSVAAIEDIRMYEGAHLEVTGDGYISFVSENAQTDQLFGMDNPMDSSAVASFYVGIDEEMQVIVGEDIPEGIYDLVAVSGWSSVCVSYPEKPYDEDFFYEYYYWLDSQTKEMSYKNIVLIDGMVVSFSDCELQFIPSEWIMHDGYDTLFEEYYYF